MTLRVKAGAATDVGRIRQINQDAFLVLPDRGLYVVADGMGGHRGGEVASKLAVDALRDTYDTTSAEALGDAIAEANLRIFDEGAADPNLQGMGTTLVAAAVVGSADRAQLLVANVGDSRGYLFRGGDLTQLTEDHSMVADLLREGRITEEEAEVHPQRNIVTRVLGVYEQVDIDFWPVDPVRGDRVLLCSDGLVNEVSADQITAVLRRLDDPQEAAAELVRRANEGGGRDNITVLIVDVVDDDGLAEAASAALADEPRGTGGTDRTAAAGDPAEPARRRFRRSEPREKVPLRARLTWRAVAFSVLLLAVIGGAFLTIQWYGQSAYFLRVDDRGEVVVFRGQAPDGVLWVDVEELRGTGHDLDEFQNVYRDDLRDGKEYSSEPGDREIEQLLKPTTTTTTSTTTTVPTSTTVQGAPPGSTP